MANKYKARKTVVNGIQFDSKKEANRFIQLMELQNQGKISLLKMQVPFTLIPNQYVGKKCVERAVKYVADFEYWDNEKDCKIVEDVKGFKGGAGYAVFRIKKKLMRWIHGIEVKEI